MYIKSCWWSGEIGAPVYCCWECKRHNHCGKAWKFLGKSNLYPPYDLVVSYVGVYLTEMKAYVHTKVEMLVVALFIVSPNWKQHKFLSVGDQINYGIIIKINTTQQ